MPNASISQIEVNSTVYDLKDANSVHTSDKGTAGGVASLDENGKVPASQLPSTSGATVDGKVLIL